MKFTVYISSYIRLIILFLYLFLIPVCLTAHDIVLRGYSFPVNDTFDFKEIRKSESDFKSDFIVILDPAHGYDVSGKRSPDGRFEEWKWSREIIRLISGMLDSLGINSAYDNDTDYEIGLKNRVRNTNLISGQFRKRAVFISIHADAAGMGNMWMKARGFSIYTTRGETRADAYAEIIYDEFRRTFPEIKTREDFSDGDADIESNFSVLLCTPPAVLIETMFQDNEKDVEILLSDDFKIRFAGMIVNAVKIIYESYYAN